MLKYEGLEHRNKKSVKAISVATLAGVASLGAMNSAFAEEFPVASTLGQNNAYTIVPGNEADYLDAIDTFKYSYLDENNELVSDYYKVELKDLGSYFEDSGHITYEKVDASGDDVFEIYDLSEYDTQYYKYTYVQPADYSTLSEKKGDDWVDYRDKYVYKDITSYTDGGAIDNTQKKGSVNLNVDFNNVNVYGVVLSSKEVLGRGGALKNDPSGLVISTSSQIGNISGDFVNNSMNTLINETGNGYSQGGAIYNFSPDSALVDKSSVIGEIEGNFVGNTALTITSKAVTLDEIKDYIPADKVPDSLFTGTTGKAYARGGAIYNNNAESTDNISTIGNITGDFISNSAFVKTNDYGYSYGGAIANFNVMKDITGSFVSNKAVVLSNYYNYSNSDYAKAYGGTIYNSNGTMGNINGDFVSNVAAVGAKNADLSNVRNWTGQGFGGAIANDNGTMGTLTGNFVNNMASKSGGAIYNVNGGTIGDINGHFVYNVARGDGGAIFNEANLGNITGDFVENGASSGGAIVNNGTIKDITGDFVINVATDGGGAISNMGTIGNVVGHFIGNTSINSSGSAGSLFAGGMAGAIANMGTFESITGSFIDNKASAAASIYNAGLIKSLNGDFISNMSVMANIYNAGQIEAMSGNFIGNSSLFLGAGGLVNSSTINNLNSNFIANEGSIMGGAIQNTSTIDSINGDFSYNKANGNFDDFMFGVMNMMGGSIGSKEEFDNLDLDAWYQEQFEKIDPNSSTYYKDLYDLNSFNTSYNIIKYMRPAFGGGIFNSTLDLSLLQSVGIESGGTPYTKFDINNIKIGDIKGDFVGNIADGNVSYGGAIANVDWANKMSFIWQMYEMMGAFQNEEEMIKALTSPQDITINSIEGTFINNKAASGGAIANFAMDKDVMGPLASVIDIVIKPILGEGNEGTIPGVFSYPDYIAKELGISPEEVLPGNLNIGKISGNFEGNQATVTDFENFDKAMDTIFESAETYKQYLTNGADVTWEECIDMLKTALDTENAKPSPNSSIVSDLEKQILIFENLKDVDKLVDSLKGSLGKGGAIFNKGGKIGEILNSSFVGNSASTTFDGVEAQGGAIWTDTDLKISATEGYESLFEGNFVDQNGEVRPEAIYVKNAELNLETKTGGKFLFNDEINGSEYKLTVSGDDTGVVTFNNNIKNAEITLNNNTVNVTQGEFLGNNNSLTLNSGILNINHLGLTPTHLNDISLVSGQMNIDVVDVDLANETMGRISADTYSNVSSDVAINVGAFNLTSDAAKDRTDILFADSAIKDNVQTGVSSLPIDGVQTAYTPIYKYNVAYDNREDGGFFVFNRASSGGNNPPAQAFNPAVLAGPVAAHAGAVSVATQTLHYAFQHSNEFMHIPYSERLSMKNRNKYALSPMSNTGMGRFSPLYQPSDEGASVWLKSYATFENIPFKNGPKVSNITYGTLAGFDTEMQQVKHGWDRVISGFVGYHGASQRFSGVDSIQNGGMLGGTVTMYKGNFFNATTVSVGANVAQNQTMYGHEDFAMLLSSIGNKSGYNFEFKEGRLILQPNMLMSYTFVNTFDYTNAAGVRIDSDPLHALQLAPGVKIIGNLKHGWQPYASVSMIWNLMGESDATANGVRLPQMSVKPYVQYGVGVQKRIKDHFMGYGQAMIHNGGRNGVSLTAGFRWALGHDNCKYEKTQRQPEVKQNLTIKQTKSSNAEILKQVQDDRGKYIGHSELNSESINANNKTSALGVGGVMPRAAEHKKILKQMTPEQKMAHGSRYMNTSRTAKVGSLR